MQHRIFFTHIPKTAGSSVKHTLIYPNYKEEEIYCYQGLKRIILCNKKKVKIVIGHFPFGLHRLFFDSFAYTTFLRDPLERVISHYYWVKETKYPTYEHPDWKLHSENSLEEFFDKRKFDKFSLDYFRLIDNLQTRYIAGIENRWRSKDSEYMLETAKLNLVKYYKIFGIQEEFEKSINLLKTNLGLSFQSRVTRQKLTNKKPDISKKTMENIKKNNQLDLYLYDYALKIFQKF